MRTRAATGLGYSMRSRPLAAPVSVHVPLTPGSTSESPRGTRLSVVAGVRPASVSAMSTIGRTIDPYEARVAS